MHVLLMSTRASSKTPSVHMSTHANKWRRLESCEGVMHVLLMSTRASSKTPSVHMSTHANKWRRLESCEGVMHVHNEFKPVENHLLK